MATMKDLFTFPSQGLEPIKFMNTTYVAGTINATDIVTGENCVIKTVGTTDYTTVGSPNNNVGQSFTATGTPTGSGTVYLADTGLHGRFKKLKDGNMYTWPISYGGSGSPQLIMENASRFINYFDSKTGSSRELSMKDFYDNPLVVATKKLIDSETITAANVDTTSALVTVSGAHEFENGMKVTLSGMNNSWSAVNGQDFFASNVSNASNGTLKLRVGSASGPYVRFFDLENASVSAGTSADPVVFTDSSGHDLTNGTQVTVTGLNGDLSIFNNGTFYVTGVSGNDFKLALNSDQSGEIGISTASTNNAIDHWVLTSSNNLHLYANSGVTQLANGTKIQVDNQGGSTYELNDHIVTQFSNQYYLEELATDKYLLHQGGALASAINVQSSFDKKLFVRGPFNTTIQRNSNDYTLLFAIPDSNFVTSATPDKIINMSASNSAVSPHNVAPLTTTGLAYSTYHTLVRDGIDSYKISGYDASDYILNADTVVTTTTDNRVFIPKIYDSAGAEISTSSFVLDPTTITSTSALDTALGANSYNAAQANNIDNVPSGAKTLTRRTATYNGKPVINISSGTVSENFDTSSLTLETVEHKASGLTNIGEVRKVDGTEEAAFYNFCKTRHDSDPNSILLSPIVVNETDGDIQHYLVVVNVDTVNEKIRYHNYTIQDNGTPGTRLTEFEGSGADHFETYRLEPYNIVTSGGSSRTISSQTDNMTFFDAGSSNTSFIDFGQISNVTAANIKSGMICTVKVKDTATNTVQATYSDHIIMADGSGTSNKRFGFMKRVGGVIQGQGGFGITGMFGSYSSGHYVEIETSDELVWKRTGITGATHEPADNNYIFVADTINTVLTSGTFANLTEYKYPGNTFDVLATGTDATAGTVTEVRTAADAGQIQVSTPTAATTGTIAPATSEPYRYEIDTVTMYLPGNQKYTFQNTSNVTTAGAQVKTTAYWDSAGTSETTYASTGETAAQFSATTDSSGYLTGVTLTEEVDAEGRYADDIPIMLLIESQADTYAPRATTTAETEDVFNTQDYWVDPTFNPLKVWPDHVGPSSAKIVQNHPSTTTVSQNGTKFVRTSGFTKWQLEVEYPPLTKDQFLKFQAVANAVQGQNIPFQFNNLNGDNTPIIFNCNFTNTNGDIHPELVSPATLGDSVLQFGGFDSNQTKAFNKGEVVIFDSNNNNSQYNVCVHDADANEYGEVKVRFAYPITRAYDTGKTCFKNPAHIHVTLAADEFEYTIGTNGYYYLTCKFDLDEYK